jgi:hypothetical protein
MSLKKHQVLPVYLPDARAVAFGGEITGVAVRPLARYCVGAPHEEGAEHRHDEVSIPFEGASCALAPGVHRAEIQRAEAITYYRDPRVSRALALSRAAHLQASARLRLTEEGKAVKAVSTARMAVQNLVIGVPGESLTIETASAQMEYSRDMSDPHESRFELHQPFIAIEGIKVSFYPASEIPDRFDAVVKQVGNGGVFRKHYDLTKEEGRCRPEDVDPEKLLLKANGKGPDTIIFSIVKRIECSLPGAIPLAPHGIYIPRVGQIYFGEMVVREHSRYFSLYRMALGCHVEGHSGGGVGGNGEPGGGKYP